MKNNILINKAIEELESFKILPNIEVAIAFMIEGNLSKAIDTLSGFKQLDSIQVAIAYLIEARNTQSTPIENPVNIVTPIAAEPKTPKRMVLSDILPAGANPSYKGCGSHRYARLLRGSDKDIFNEVMDIACTLQHDDEAIGSLAGCASSGISICRCRHRQLPRSKRRILKEYIDAFRDAAHERAIAGVPRFGIATHVKGSRS